MSDEAAYRKRLEEYATHLILTNGTTVTEQAIREQADGFFDEGERPLNPWTAMHVEGLIARATVTVGFPPCCPDCEKEAGE